MTRRESLAREFGGFLSLGQKTGHGEHHARRAHKKNRRRWNAGGCEMGVNCPAPSADPAPDARSRRGFRARSSYLTPQERLERLAMTGWAPAGSRSVGASRRPSWPPGSPARPGSGWGSTSGCGGWRTSSRPRCRQPPAAAEAAAGAVAGPGAERQPRAFDLGEGVRRCVERGLAPAKPATADGTFTNSGDLNGDGSTRPVISARDDRGAGTDEGCRRRPGRRLLLFLIGRRMHSTGCPAVAVAVTAVLACQDIPIVHSLRSPCQCAWRAIPGSGISGRGLALS